MTEINTEINMVGSKHEEGVKKLIEEFGSERETEIRTTYREQMEKLERDATVFLYIPILALNAVRRILQTQSRK